MDFLKTGDVPIEGMKVVPKLCTGIVREFVEDNIDLFMIAKIKE
jgi:hypothetical protein